MHYEVKGSGPAVVLLHQGIVDSRVWEPQWESFGERYRLLRCDLAGFGRSPIESVPLCHAQYAAALLDDLGISGAGLVGGSLGGRIALEIAVARPELVGALVLVAAGLPGVDWSQTVREYWAAEDAAVIARRSRWRDGAESEDVGGWPGSLAGGCRSRGPRPRRREARAAARAAPTDPGCRSACR